MKLFCASSTFSTESWDSSPPRLAQKQFLKNLPLFDVLIGAFMFVNGVIFAATYLPEVVR